MFGFKKKRNELYAPVDGKLIPIDEVADPVFSKKMVGDGFAVISSGDTIYAPADANVTMIFPGGHVIGLTLTSGTEIMIHVGIDTVNEEGKGFEGLCKQGQQVKKGDALIKIDRSYLEKKGYDLSVIVIFTNQDTYKEFTCENVTEVIGGKTLTVSYTI